MKTAKKKSTADPLAHKPTPFGRLDFLTQLRASHVSRAFNAKTGYPFPGIVPGMKQLAVIVPSMKPDEAGNYPAGTTFDRRVFPIRPSKKFKDESYEVQFIRAEYQIPDGVDLTAWLKEDMARKEQEEQVMFRRMADLKVTASTSWESSAVLREKSNPEQKPAVVKPEQKPKKEVKPKEPVQNDKWGYRVGSGAALINLVITKEAKSARQIEKESKCGRKASPHLATLVGKGLIVKVKMKKTGEIRYRLPK